MSEPASPTPTPESPPRSTSKTVATVVIGMFLVLQIGAPLSYYLGDDRFDERFAWRMFSPIRMAKCSARLYDATGGGETEIRLSKEVHMVWANLLRRARRSVLDGFAAKWCSEGDGRVLHADLTCVPPEATKHPICKSITDRNGDGAPDGFSSHDACGKDLAQDCFKRMCGDASPRDCYTEHCSVRIVPRDLDLCGGGES